MRHGERKDGKNGGLTDNGKLQVATSARKNLNTIIFDAFYSSEKKRAIETIECVTETIYNLKKPDIIKHDCFNYEGAPEEDSDGTIDEKVKKLTEQKSLPWPTIQIWNIVAPNKISFLRLRIRLGLQIIALETIAKNHGMKDEYNILVGSHSPLAELGGPDMCSMPQLRQADIAKYVVTFNGDVSIDSCEYLPR